MLSIKIPDPRAFLASSRGYSAFQRLIARKNALARLAGLLDIKPGSRVLDIGCGPANILSYLPRDIDYHGFDMSPAYIAAARRRHGARGNFMVRAVTPGAIDDLGSFDVVTAIGVLHHLTDGEADALFAAARQSLCPGGRVVAVDCVFTTPQNPVARLLINLDRGHHVRTVEGYAALARRHFPDVECRFAEKLHVLPYTLNILVAHQPFA